MLLRRNVVGEPGLTAFVIAPDGIRVQEALVRGALLLHGLIVVEGAVGAGSSAGTAGGHAVGRGAFNPEIELRHARHMRQIQAGSDGGTPRCGDGVDVVVREGI